MKSQSESLLEILEEISGQYESLEMVLQDEKRSLLRNSLDGIVECGKKKETITLKLSILEESRKKSISEMSMVLARSESEIDLALLCQDSDPSIASRFVKMKSTLTPLVRRVERLNRENKHFIEESIAGIASTFSFFNRITNERKTYRNSGEYAASKNGSTGKVLCQQV